MVGAALAQPASTPTPALDRKVSFNFTSAKVVVILSWFREQFGLATVAPPDAQSLPLTIITTEPATLEQTHELLTIALQVHGYTAILNRENRVLEVADIKTLNRQKLRALTNPTPEALKESQEVVVAHVTLEQGNAQAMKTYLVNDLALPAWVAIEADPGRKTLVIVATQTQLKRILKAIQEGQKSLTATIDGVSARLFPLRYLQARYAFQMLVDLFKLTESQAKQGTGDRGQGTGAGVGGIGALLDKPPKPPPAPAPKPAEVKTGGGGESRPDLRSAVGLFVGKTEDNKIQYQIYLDGNLNAIHAIAPPPMLATIEQFLKQIDIEPLARGLLPSLPYMKTYTLNFLDVVTMIDILNPMFVITYPESTSTTSSSTTSGAVASSGQNSFSFTPSSSSSGAATSSAANFKDSGSTSGVVTKIFPGYLALVGNPSTNTLLVLAQQTDQETVADVIKKMDQPSPQVLIEISAMEVGLTDATKFGVTAFLQNALSSQQTGGLSVNIDAQHLKFPMTPTVTAEGSFAILSNNQMKLLLDLLKKQSKLSVISVPKVIAQNNKGAGISIKDTLYWVKQTSVQTGTKPSGDPIYQLVDGFEPLDTGLELIVKPKINDQQQVFLDIVLMLSEVSGDAIKTGAPPPQSKREIRVSAVVKNRETVFIGGLVKNKKIKTEIKTPLLSDLPLIGSLFSWTNEESAQRELVLFLTPQVLTDRPGDLQQMMDRQRGLNPNVNWPSPNE